MASNVEDPFIGERFGSEGQLEVIGWFGELSGSNKKYTLFCSVCSKDPELYGDGKFLATKSHLQTGRVPCGCAKKYIKTRKQIEVLIERELGGSGFKFIGWQQDDKFTRTASRIIISCPLHGVLEPKDIGSIFAGVRCRECRVEALRQANLIDDSLLIQRFFEVGDYHPDTEFWRSEKLTPHKKYRLGTKRHWFVCCGECRQTTETLYSTLMRGGKSCRCGKHSQRYAYLHKISDGETPIALKFGIAINHRRRILKQRRSTVFDIETLGIWKFETTQLCKLAEREVINSVDCGLLSKLEFEDGHTETTSLFNIEKIIRIYESYGGIRMEVR